MKAPTVFLCLALATSPAFSESLTSADREALLENLEKLQKQVDDRSDARFRAAITAYRGAMTSDDQAAEFYLKCVEKVEYTDLKRKGKDFRDWKKKEKGNLDRPAFRRALRHQLRWLCLTLEAASSNPDKDELVQKARTIVRDVFDDLKMMGDQERVLTQAVSSTVFAKAYDIDGIKGEDWPTSPLKLDELYDKLFLPPYRNPAGLSELRATWMKRIEQELAIRENMAAYSRRLLKEQQRQQEEYQTQNAPNEKNYDYNETKIGTVEAMRPPEYRQFLADEVPELLWQMEVDLFKHGDEAGASKRMLEHLVKYTHHKSVGKWNDELTGLLKAGEEAPAEPAQQAQTQG